MVDKDKFGAITVGMSAEINGLVGTTLSFGACVGGLIGLWLVLRTLVVVSLSLQDKSF